MRISSNKIVIKNMNNLVSRRLEERRLMLNINSEEINSVLDNEKDISSLVSSRLKARRLMLGVTELELSEVIDSSIVQIKNIESRIF